jgi:hypothetical protein
MSMQVNLTSVEKGQLTRRLNQGRFGAGFVYLRDLIQKKFTLPRQQAKHAARAYLRIHHPLTS